jgi:hypothetical protein
LPADPIAKRNCGFHRLPQQTIEALSTNLSPLLYT